jgi:hypothetical protein
MVPNYWDAIQGRFPIDNGPALPGDTYIWIDNNGIQQHIGIADGKGNVISALNTIQNICVVPARLVNIPILKVLHTGLEQNVSLGTSVGKAHIGTDPEIRGIGPANELYVLPLGKDVDIYGVVTQVGFGGGLAFIIAEPNSGKPIHLLERNTIVAGYSATADILQAKITKAIADLS